MDHTETQQTGVGKESGAPGDGQLHAPAAEEKPTKPSDSTPASPDTAGPAVGNESLADQELQAPSIPHQKSVEPAPRLGQPGPAAVDQRKKPRASRSDTTSPWFYLILGFIVVLATTMLMWLFHLWAPPKDPTETGVRAEIWLFLAIPGVTMVLLGAYMFWKARRDWVLYRMNRKDLLVTAVQLVPGTALAALGNVLPVDHDLVSTWPITPSWASLILGVLVSVLLVRKFEKRSDEAAQPQITSQ